MPCRPAVSRGCLTLSCHRCRTMILLPGLLFILLGEPGRCRGEGGGGFAFNGAIRHFAVATNSVYIATDQKLYHLSHGLTLVQSLSQRGTKSDSSAFYRVSETARWNTTFSVNVLLPFVENKTLISCGVIEEADGYCEVLDLMNISKFVHKEGINVGLNQRTRSASVSFLVTLQISQNPFYILSAKQQNKTSDSNTALDIVELQNTDEKQYGGIFSLTDLNETPTFKSKALVDFVDGFQINSTIYLLSTVRSGTDEASRVRLIWFEKKDSKAKTLKSLRVVTLKHSDAGHGSRLLASSVVPGGPPVLWSGVFSVDGGQTDTELLVFDISPDLTTVPNADEDFYSDEKKPNVQKAQTQKAVILRWNKMTSVLAVKKKGWTVFFIGTEDGQLIKLNVDKNFHTSCPTVLYKASDDRRVFPKLHLDQVDHKHVYVPFQTKIERVPVSKCTTYTDLQACWSAQDPYCVWCGSERRCTFDNACKDSDWLSIPDDYQQKMVSHLFEKDSTGKIRLNIQTHLTVGQKAFSNFACHFSVSSRQLCNLTNAGPPKFPQCTCILSDSSFLSEGLTVTVRIRLGTMELNERLMLTNCSNIRGPPTSALCRQCMRAGCGWSKNHCSWANRGVRNDTVCQNVEPRTNYSKPEISSITPNVVSFYGRNHAVLSGHNLSNVTRVRIQTEDCTPLESLVWNKTDVNLTFHILKTNIKAVVKVCALLPDDSCHGNMKITYKSSPSCIKIVPNSTWASGKRKVTTIGTNLDLVEGITHSHALQETIHPENSSYEDLTYYTSGAASTRGTFNSTVFLKVANETLPCSANIIYYPDPEFTHFTSTHKGDHVRIVIEKKADKLELTTAELSVFGIHKGKEHSCTWLLKETKNKTDYFTCDIKSTTITKFQQIMIRYGDKTIPLNLGSPPLYIWMLLILLLIPFIIITVIILYRSKQKKLTAEMNRFVEDLELDIRNDIRQGFVDLQTEKADLMENVGAIPFLDYKHFATRIFFPENEALMALCIRDIGQDAVTVQLDESCQGLSGLIQDQFFLTSMVHTLEEQKSFTIKDKCMLASLLTVALHGNLLYLTEVMEVLLKALMHQHSNTQPKLLLRRTESTVEKLLTNWMSICLYGFLRESVGQNLFLMVSALTQQIAKGPVDCVTEKALYTLSEDWLLWQAPNFSSLKLKVLFAVGSDGEVSEPLEVSALSCDSVEQLKEKILSTFKAKFGFPYNIPLRDVCVEYEKNGCFSPLEEVDGSSEVIGEVTMLNTLNHYKVPDGATIKVLSKKIRPPLSPQGSLKDDANFSGKYFHLIDPDVAEDQRKNPERKKLKLKEVHLTKLLSTKVAVHSFVENLFKTIWGTPHSRALYAVKYFFDFLDTQADNMKITDPEVLHIWKTNSLPLRFWVNILKNPQFVFDMEKTPHLDGCLSVIAQAFMDSFSLSETQMGKHAPTNKLLYAKDIPKFKQEVKAYYKQIREQSPIADSEFKDFLQEESKKHVNEFNEAAALRELYRFIQRYFTEIKEKLNQNGAPTELVEQLHHVKKLFDGLKSCSWN